MLHLESVSAVVNSVASSRPERQFYHSTIGSCGQVLSRTGKQADAIYSDPSAGGAAFEYGASECCRVPVAEYNAKWRSDRNKLAILLRDQIVYINKGTYGRSSVLRQVQTIGFLTAACSYQSMRLCYPAGNICILVPILEDVLWCRETMRATRRVARQLHNEPGVQEFLALSWSDVD